MEKREMTVAHWKHTVSGYACQDTATGTPAGDQRYIRSDPPRLLLKLVRLVRLDINCRQLAWMRLLVHERSAKRYIYDMPVFFYIASKYNFLFYFKFERFNQTQLHEGHWVYDVPHISNYKFLKKYKVSQKVYLYYRLR